MKQQIRLIDEHFSFLCVLCCCVKEAAKKKFPKMNVYCHVVYWCTAVLIDMYCRVIIIEFYSLIVFWQQKSGTVNAENLAQTSFRLTQQLRSTQLSSTVHEFIARNKGHHDNDGLASAVCTGGRSVQKDTRPYREGIVLRRLTNGFVILELTGLPTRGRGRRKSLELRRRQSVIGRKRC